jgi:hypothetical protein
LIVEKSLFISALVGLFWGQLFGQDTAVLTKNFRFADGVYFSMAQLRANSPAYTLDSLEMAYFTNPQTSLTQVDGIVFKKNKKPLQLDSIWAICLDGVPSVRVPSEEINRTLPNFAALKLRGKICYFTYPDYRKKTIRVSAYNPLTGRPFRTANVLRDEEVIVEKIMHFQTGEVADFEVKNLLDWMQEKLFKALLIYVDRNTIMMNDE